jgi:hypothetical protein
VVLSRSIFVRHLRTSDSIVSIPGLPQLFPSYKPKDDRSWLQDVLSFQFPTARILLFKYDFGELCRDIRWSRLLDEATKFLYELVHHRKEAYEVDRPIVVLCHSFGALILKQVCSRNFRATHSK